MTNPADFVISTDVKWRNLGLEVFSIIRQMHELRFFYAQLLLEKKVVECGLGAKLKQYASHPETKFELMESSLRED